MVNGLSRSLFREMEHLIRLAGSEASFQCRWVGLLLSFKGINISFQLFRI